MTPSRQETLQHIREQPEVSVLILGGGINGLGLFRELALQGVDCLLVDKGDFTSGATSKSSRMIHGGLRYLENREFRLVKESLHERNRLLVNAPHAVAPLRTTIPFFSWFGGMLRSPLIFLGFPIRTGKRGALIAKLGLWVYDFLTRKERRTPTHFLWSRAKSLQEIPQLNEGIVATGTYWDAWITQAERLCIDLIRDARESCPECHALNYVEPVGMEDGKVQLKDGATGETVSVAPGVVVNATGAWVDMANQSLNLETRYMGGTKGSHLVVDNEELFASVGDRMVYYQHEDGRVCIVFRFLGKVIMGSTDIRIENPDTAVCDSNEIEYMLETLRGVFPQITVSREDVVFKFCGVRPLPSSEGSTTGQISRDHKIEHIEPDAQRPFPVYCLIGGKWTTFRALAEQTTDRVLAKLGVARKASTVNLPIGGAKDYPSGEEQRRQWIDKASADSGLPSERVAALLDRYGSLAKEYIAGLGGSPEKSLETLPHYSISEIEHLVSTERVEHLTDLICRRSLIALLGEASAPALAELAGIVGRLKGWDPEREKEEVAAAEREVAV